MAPLPQRGLRGHGRPRPGALVLIGHGFHSFVDGVAIGAAVQTSMPLGVSTAIAVALHEVPQQVGDFAVLLHAGYQRGPALGLSVLSAAGAVTGTIAAFMAFGQLPGILPYALTLAAASFLYIAMADLIPDLHKGKVDARAFKQLLILRPASSPRSAFASSDDRDQYLASLQKLWRQEVEAAATYPPARRARAGSART